MKKKIQSTLALLLCLACCLAGASYAWLADHWSSAESVLDFTAGDVTPPTGVMWLYDTAQDLGAQDPGGWTQHALTPDAADGFLLLAPGVEQTQTGGAYSFALRSLHLGTVDNLVTLAPDNTVVLRLALDAALQGNTSATVTLAPFGDVAQGVHVYDGEGAAQTDAALMQALADIHTQTPFMRFAACLDARALTPADADYETLDFCTPVPIGESIALIADAASAPMGAYYIYVEITPSLAAFAAASEELNRYMPCTLLFDTRLTLDVH